MSIFLTLTDGCGNNMEKFLRTVIGIRIKQNQNDKRETGGSRSESKEEYHEKKREINFFLQKLKIDI